MGGHRSEAGAAKFTVAALAAFGCAVYFKVAPYQLAIGACAALYAQRQIAAGANCKALQSTTNLAGKVALVTGANAGIGYFTALQLAEMGATVVISCRNAELTKATGDRLRADAAKRGASKAAIAIVDHLALECDDFASIRRFVSTFAAEPRVQLLPNGAPRLDILVNNAGMMVRELQFSKFHPKYELHTAVNFLGPVLLTELLMPTLKQSNGRVVNVASVAHEAPPSAGVTPANLVDQLFQVNAGRAAAAGAAAGGCLLASAKSDFHTAFCRYGMSKLMNVYYAHYLAQVHQVPTCSLHPGIVTTSFLREYVPPAWTGVLEGVGKFWLKSSEEGAQTSVYGAICPVDALRPVDSKKGTSGEMQLMARYLVECRDQTATQLRPIGFEPAVARRVVEEFALKELAPFLAPIQP